MVARTRRSVPGSGAFVWLMVAVALWCLTSALHTIVTDTTARVVIARLQYFAIAPIGVLWLLFAAGHARARWLLSAWLRWSLMAIPAVTVAAALTNDYHGLIWTAITPVDTRWGPQLVYTGGSWFWVHLAYTYALFIAGTTLLATGLRRFPPPYRTQTWAVIVGGLAPWVGNFLYVAQMTPVPGVDPTPLAFAVSGLCFTWGLYRYRLFGLVPIARDMVVDSMEDGVVVLDAQRRIVDLNAAAERYTGCSPASIGRSIEEVVAWWNEAIAEERSSDDMPAVVKTEPGPRYFEVRVSPVRDPERHFAGWLVIIRDITLRRRIDAERYALERRLQEQQKSESLTIFAAGVAHDFNNLLTGILGNADLLAIQAPADSPQRRTAEAIIIGAQRAADLVAKMLAYAGEGRVVSERVDLDTLTREMVDVMAVSARHCTLTYSSPGPLPAVDADPTQVRQVVLNLILNAVEAVDEGGLVTVATGQETLGKAALAQMTFGSDADPGPYLYVDVVDNGPGMSDETLARIFDPFYSTRDQGRGLGLAAVRGIVRSHRATLRVTTKAGQGTRFRVWLSLTPGRQVVK
jgi:PAS domain S-box-containing protein